VSDAHEQKAQELVVVDAAGRLQLSGEQRHLAGIGRRARVEVVDGGLLIRPGDEAPPPERLAAGDLDDYDALNGPPASPRRRRRLPWRRRNA
jgi:peptide/nickel transport system ATP-binding protein